MSTLYSAAIEQVIRIPLPVIEMTSTLSNPFST